MTWKQLTERYGREWKPIYIYILSHEYPQSMFLSRNKKINVYPCKPWFYCIKGGFKGFKPI